MSKIYLIGGIAAAFAALLWWHMQVAEENAQLKVAVESAAKTIQLMDRDRQAKEDANQQLRQQREELEHEKARLVSDLEQLPRTEAQRDCDSSATPNGYSERMLDYARDQGKVLETRPDVVTGDAPVSGSEKPGDLRTGQE